MIKDFMYNKRAILLEWYMVAAATYIFMYAMNIGIISLGIIIGLVNTYITAPIIYSSKFGNEDLIIPKQNTFKNILKSILICLLISFVYFLTDQMFFQTYLEPITFGIIYKIIDLILMKIMGRFKQE